VVSGRNGNGNRFLTWEWVGMGMGMVLWEWERMGTEIVLPAHLYSSSICFEDIVDRLQKF